MATVVKRVLSGSTDGKPIGLTLTNGSATAAQTVHTCASSTNVFDELYIYAHHAFSSDLSVMIEFGVSGTGSSFVTTVPAKSGPVLIVPGIPIMGAITNPIIAFRGEISATSQTQTMYLTGYVNRITQ